MKPIFPTEGTQEHKVLMTLLDANGAWVNKQYFVRTLYLTQAGRAIHNLENKCHWHIQHSDFTDDHGFKSYRIVQETQPALFLSADVTPFSYERTQMQ